jgi:hypothetical protein
MKVLEFDRLDAFLELEIDGKEINEVSEIPLIDAIPLDKAKKAREEIDNLDYLINDAKYSDQETRAHNVDILVNKFYEIIDKLIAESDRGRQ